MTRQEYRVLRERAYRDASDYAVGGLTLTLFAMAWPLIGGAAAMLIVLALVNVVRFTRYDRLMRRMR